jgi:hypothetical protein
MTEGWRRRHRRMVQNWSIAASGPTGTAGSVAISTRICLDPSSAARNTRLGQGRTKNALGRPTSTWRLDLLLRLRGVKFEGRRGFLRQPACEPVLSINQNSLGPGSAAALGTPGYRFEQLGYLTTA